MNEKPHPIIQNGWSGGHIPPEKLPPDFLPSLQRTRVGKASELGRIVRILECFLQVTGRDWLPQSPAHADVIVELIGALNSDCFIQCTPVRRYVYARTLMLGLSEMQPKALPESVEETYEINTRVPSKYVRECVRRFEAIELNEQKVELCRGWPIYNAAGLRMWLPLTPFYLNLGSAFTSTLHRALGTWFARGRSTDVAAFIPLCAYLSELKEPPTLEDFQNPDYMLEFWREFAVHYVTTRATEGSKVGRLTRVWLRFAGLVTDHLTSADLFAMPTGGFPLLPRRQSPKPNIRIQNGVEVMHKMLTPVPLQITDSESMEILFNQIETDILIATKWADHQVADLDVRVRRRKRWAALGTAKIIGPSNINNGSKWLTNWLNRAVLENAAASFERYGYLTSWDANIYNIYPRPLADTAHQLGIPVADALLPHCVVLVSEHPQITQSFLENLYLYDKHGQLVGLEKTDGGWFLDGSKFRRGRVLGQQIIKLNRKSFGAVARIIRATTPVRKYLREKKDDRWRFMLLATGPGFGRPTKVGLSPLTAAGPAAEKLARRLEATYPVDHNERLEYAKRFSLDALRDSVAVLAYIKTGDARTMAEALGHAQFSPRLLARYLPEPLLLFLQERWVRLFQEGLVLQAMEGSNLLLKASSFSKMSEVDEFLRLHALRVPTPSSDTGNKAPGPTSTAAIGLNPNVLAVLLSLRAAVSRSSERPSGSAFFWASFAERVEQEIALQNREDLLFMLEEARGLVDPKAMEALIHAR